MSPVPSPPLRPVPAGRAPQPSASPGSPDRTRPLPSRRSVSRLAALAALLALPACGPARNQFAPPCPNPIFLQPTADITRFRPGSSGRDLTDLVVRARMVSLKGSCKEGSSARELDTSLSVTIEMTRGPAMQGRQAELPVFVAVTEGEDVVTKEVYPLRFEFPPNMDRAMVATPTLQITLPVSPQKSGAAYGIIAGFQLAPDELAYNRSQNGR
jgi:hypothetical protein